MIHYELNTQTCSETEYGAYVSYGVTVYRNHTVLREIADVSVDKDRVEALVRLFNEEALSLAHLDEAIEDFLISLEV